MKALTTAILAIVLSPEEQKAQGELRHKSIAECIEMAVKNERKWSDDVSDIVEECGKQKGAKP